MRAGGGIEKRGAGELLLNVGEVTSRRKVDVAIHFQARLLAAVGQAIIAVDTTSRIVYWNEAAERMYGWSAEEAIGSDVLSLITGPADATLVEEIAACLMTGASWTGDFWGLRKDGSTFPVLVTDTPVLDDKGKLIAIIGVSTDITERKAAEETSARLSAIVASSNDAIYSWTLEGIVQTWNAAAERLFGFKASEVVGRHVTMIVPEGHVSEVDAFLKRIGSDDRIEPFVTQRRCADETMVDVSVIVSPLLDDGHIVGASVIARDITEELQMHEEADADRRRLLEAQEIAGLGSLELVLHSGAMTWTQHLYRLLEVDPTTEPSLAVYLAQAHPVEREGVEKAFATAAEGEDIDLAHRVSRTDGDRWVRLRLRPDGAGLVRGTVLDVTDRRRTEHQRWEAEQRFAAGFEHAGIGMATADLQGGMTRLNPKLCELLGRPEAELVGRPLGDLVHPDERRTQLVALHKMLSGQGTDHQGECRLHGAEGHQPWVLLSLSIVLAANGEPAYVFMQAQDISDRKMIEDALEQLALHDALTQLPNRLLLSDRLETALRRAERDGHALGVLFLDLDGFKLVNDSLGHVAGDRLLMQVSQRLLGASAAGDTVARFGGDEFVIVGELTGPGLRAMGQRYLDTFSEPFRIDGNELYATASIGATVARGDETSTALLRDADAAMYQAKENGRARIELFGEKLRGAASRRLAIESVLRAALDAGQFRLKYQPIMDLERGVVVGAEALIRWEHPTLGPVTPDEFVPLTEESGLIVPIGAWVLEEALAQLARWRSRLPDARGLWMAVNLSARQLLDGDAVDNIIRIVHEAGVPATSICLELTETAVMEDAEASIRALGALANAGIKLSIDDFGTGYSSLSYLKQFPVDVLKIDRSFVADLGRERHDSSILNAVVGLGRALGLELLAEGVETDVQLAYLRTLGVRLGQGFLWNPALESAAFAANLRATNQHATPRPAAGVPAPPNRRASERRATLP